jgi:hypothetical protein
MTTTIGRSAAVWHCLIVALASPHSRHPRRAFTKPMVISYQLYSILLIRSRHRAIYAAIDIPR